MAIAFYDENEIRKTIATMYGEGECFEVRLVPGSRGNNKIISGYFQDADTLISALKKIDMRGVNAYITLGSITTDMMSRTQGGRFVQGAATTSDNDVVGYKWLPIDIDPERPSGTSAKIAELSAAKDVANKLYDYMAKQGLNRPLVALSGNGIHMLYPVSLSNTAENRELIENALKSLDAMFSTDDVKVDTANFNPSRIFKLYGTLAQKGQSTQERPHRMAKIIKTGDGKVNSREYIEAIANNEIIKAEKAKPSKYNGYKPSEFDLEQWLCRHGISFKEMGYKSGRKYVLSECPFNPNHKAPDSAVFQTTSGAIGFKCLHNSCQGKTWQDMRLLFEPDAYDFTPADNDKRDKRIEEGWKAHNRDLLPKQLAPDKPMFETASEIFARPEPEHIFIKSGFYKLDSAIRGLEKGKIGLLTGLRGGAKSTILSQVLLNAVDQGHRVVAYSGELKDKAFLNWLMLQAAGRCSVVQSSKYANYYEVPDDVQSKIVEWLGDNFLLYANEHGHDWIDLYSRISEKVKAAKADMVIIDNLMTLDIDSLNEYDKYSAQTRFIQSLKIMAAECNCYVLLVAHPRKAMGLLRLDDVAGSGNLTNYVDNAFIAHRINDDFLRNCKSTLGWKDTHPILQSHCTNAIEICKDRESGTSDYWIDLYYEPQTKRLKSYPAENRVFGWEEVIRHDFIPDDDIEF